MKYLLGNHFAYRFFILIFLTVLGAQSFAQGPRRKVAPPPPKNQPKSVSAKAGKQEYQVHINVGVGPALHMLPFPQIEGQPQLQPGFALDFYGVAGKEVIQAQAGKIKNRKMRNFAKGLEEIRISPFWINLIPDRVMIAPGDSLAGYGATWTLLGMSLAIVDGESFRINARARIPSLTYAYLEGPALQGGDKHFFGLGAVPALHVELFDAKPFYIDIGYRHNLYLPLASNQLELADGTKQQVYQHGTAHLLLNYRIPYKVRM